MFSTSHKIKKKIFALPKIFTPYRKLFSPNSEVGSIYQNKTRIKITIRNENLNFYVFIYWKKEKGLKQGYIFEHTCRPFYINFQAELNIPRKKLLKKKFPICTYSYLPLIFFRVKPEPHIYFLAYMYIF